MLHYTEEGARQICTRVLSVVKYEGIRERHERLYAPQQH